MSTETTTVQAGAALRGEPAAPGALAADLRDARARTQAYVADLSDARLMPPLLECINPLLWELGHVAYFAEFWTLRHLTGRAPLLADADQLYDSAKIAHDERWHLPLPSRQQTAAFMERQLAGTLALLDVEPARSDGGTYFHRLALFHEDMHGEALLYTRQTLAYERPALTYAPKPGGGALPGDVAIPGGSYTIGTPQDERHFVFDNEKWAHEVELAPFAIARAPVTCAEFRGFVEDRGYLGRRFWSDEGWAWREAAQAEHPLQWQRTQSNGWERRHFARFVPLADNEPIAGVNAFEAEAYCA